MKWKQHWNSKQVIYNRLQIHSGLIHEAPKQVGVLRNTFLHTIFQQNPHKNIQTTNSSNTEVYNAWQFRQWYLHLQCSWQYKCRNDQLQYGWSGVLMPLRWKANGYVLHEKAQNQNAMSHHFAHGNFRYWSRSLRICTKLQEGWQQSLSCITVYKSRAESLCTHWQSTRGSYKIGNG